MLEFTPREQVYLETDEMMTPEITYAIRLKFEYKLSDHLAGFYLSKYIDKNGKEGWDCDFPATLQNKQLKG